MKRRDFIGLSAGALAFPVGACEPKPGELYKSRPCDGACCHQSPLRPVGDGRECFFHDHSMQFDVNSGCRVMADPSLLAELTEAEAKRFAEACVGYPIPYAPSSFGACCWRRKT